MQKDEFTKAELLALASDEGFRPTGRLIDDWVALGLLDRPRRKGLGPAAGVVGVWSGRQARLFLSLLRHQTTTHRVKTLCNLPVWLWLDWGPDYVPLRQVRRAMATWAQGSRTTAVRHVAAATARATEGLALSPSSTKFLRGLLKEALFTGSLDEYKLMQVAKHHAHSDTEGLARIMRARYRALRDLARISDETYANARAVYRLPAGGMPRDEDNQRATSACLVLLTILGFEVTEGRAAIPAT